MLNELFSEFDALCNEFGVYKVETIGDCYVVAAGLVEPDEEGFMQISPNLDPSDSAERLLQFSKRMMAHSRTVPVPRSALYVTVSQARDQPITPFTPNTPGIDLHTLFPGTNWHSHRPLCDRADRLQDAQVQHLWGLNEHRLSHGELLHTRTHPGQCSDGVGEDGAPAHRTHPGRCSDGGGRVSGHTCILYPFPLPAFPGF